MFSSLHRDRVIKEMTNTPLDVIVIGGGITGAGIALDAVERGLRVAVLDMQDFSSGTSSRSTKLIHGGLRYLKQLDFKVVSETGKERAIVYENGPHVTQPEWMLLPFYEGGTFGPRMMSIGLRMYDFLAGVNPKERRQMLSPEEAVQREPLLNKDTLLGAGLYVEYKTDDARLTIEVIKKAVEKGALALNYMKVTNFIYENNKIIGVEVENQLNQAVHSLYAKQVVNASGPWVDTLRHLDGSREGKRLHVTKGAHLVFDANRFPLKQAIYFDAADGRMIFAIPREGKTYVGTTDTVYAEDFANPAVTTEDRKYLLNAMNDMFPQVALRLEDVESSWAGLRPLIYEEGKSPSEISRKDEVFTSPTGLISIAGGKLTGYRKMAENIVDLVETELYKKEGRKKSKVSTKELPISGGKVGGSVGFPNYVRDKIVAGMKLGLKGSDVEMLVKRYGSNIDVIFDLYTREASRVPSEKMDPIVFALLLYSMKHEAAYKPVDFFIRRTGALFFHIDWVYEQKDAVIDIMGELLHWSQEQKHIYMLELEQALELAVSPSLEIKTDKHA